MNHLVPDFELDDVYSLPTSSGLTKKSSMAEEDEVMELLWQNGQPVAHGTRSGRRIPDCGEAVPPTASSDIQSAMVEAVVQHQHLFMQEDEMASWLHYPLHETTFERDLSDYFNPSPPLATTINNTILVAPPLSEELKVTTSRELKVQPLYESTSLPIVVPTVGVPARPPVPPSGKQKEVLIEKPPPRKRVLNFAHFAKLPNLGRNESGASSSAKVAKESTVVESNDTPKVSIVGSNTVPEAGGSNSARDLTTTTKMNTYDFTTSSPGDSSASLSAGGEAAQPPYGNQEERKEVAVVEEDRKRKGREGDDNEGHSLDTELEFGREKKRERGSTSSTKRSRAAEVHNLSERRRRDRINERMKTLQELIPRCNKTDKASMLDEAIEYLKSLQLQVQMMSMGCGMVPMMYPGVQHYPGVQQYMPAMGMGMPMDLSMNRPLLPYPQMLQGSSMPNQAAGAHMAPRYPMQAFHMPVVHDPSRMQPPNAGDPMINPMAGHNPLPTFANPYQQYLGPQQGQVLIPQQNQAAVQQNNAKPSTSSEDRNPENRQPDG